MASNEFGAPSEDVLAPFLSGAFAEDVFIAPTDICFDEQSGAERADAGGEESLSRAEEPSFDFEAPADDELDLNSIPPPRRKRARKGKRAFPSPFFIVRTRHVEGSRKSHSHELLGWVRVISGEVLATAQDDWESNQLSLMFRGGCASASSGSKAVHRWHLDESFSTILRTPLVVPREHIRSLVISLPSHFQSEHKEGSAQSYTPPF